MSLLEEAMSDCTMIDKKTSNDGYGGYVTTWEDGATFQSAIVLDNSTQAKIAAKAGVTGLYTVTTGKSVNLQFHDVFRRERDKKIFRVTSDGDDKYTPNSVSLDMRQVSAEEWSLNDG